ncbi:transmembrane protein, putative [Medicago truncatula]|uniref:Transmembrane protein, putative n=1 Tax=Medicago truncatula TaxID=3880 RepID=G7IBV6_MEDTR|nr:transmembrane protein, putative [Medicago truncatula]
MGRVDYEEEDVENVGASGDFHTREKGAEQKQPQCRSVLHLFLYGNGKKGEGKKKVLLVAYSIGLFTFTTLYSLYPRATC